MISNDYKKNVVSLGFSDIASLTIRSGIQLADLTFGGDSHYKAYLIDKNVQVPEYYTCVFSTDFPWLKIYDDENLVFETDSNFGFRIYRAGEYGCIIQKL